MADGSEETFKSFISWSGSASRRVAETLFGALAWIMPNARPWLSSENINPGEVWFNAIRAQLDLSAGVVLLTPENLHSDWLNFEAGALLGSVKKQTQLFPVLLGFAEPAPLDNRHPLSNVQQVRGDEAGFRRIFMTLADLLKDPRPQPARDIAYSKLWEAIAPSVAAANTALATDTFIVSTGHSATGSADDALDEIRQSLRELKAELVDIPKRWRWVEQQYLHGDTQAPSLAEIAEASAMARRAQEILGGAGNLSGAATLFKPPSKGNNEK
jgi:hypothetical protein